MSKAVKMNRKMINASEIARQLGVTPEYVGMLLSGKRKNKERLEQIRNLINKEMRAA